MSLGPTYAVNFNHNNMTITDALAVPTSNNQYNNGGWRDFEAVCKNRGDCVGFVATGGKDQPAGSKKP